jgi:hypothetical protein
MPDTAIAVAAFSPQAVAAGVPVQQSYRLFYQQFDGATRELSYESNESTWRNATTIFTDARNNTGLATFSYLNQTERNVRLLLYIMHTLWKKRREQYLFLEWPLMLLFFLSSDSWLCCTLVPTTGSSPGKRHR